MSKTIEVIVSPNGQRLASKPRGSAAASAGRPAISWNRRWAGAPASN